MNKDLLDPKQFSLSSSITLKIYANNKKCSSITLQLTEKIQGKECVYFETIESQDFSHRSETSSILFLKLAIEGSLCSGYNNQKWVKYDKVENMIWEKVVVGKDRVDAALQEIKKKNPKKYEGVILQLSYPQHILIVIPKVLDPSLSNLYTHPLKQDKSIVKQEEAKRIFFSSTN